MFDLMVGLGNIVCALLNPILLKQKTRTDMFKVLSSMFLVGFLMVAVGQYYGTPQL